MLESTTMVLWSMSYMDKQTGHPSVVERNGLPPDSSRTNEPSRGGQATIRKEIPNRQVEYA